MGMPVNVRKKPEQAAAFCRKGKFPVIVDHNIEIADHGVAVFFNHFDQTVYGFV